MFVKQQERDVEGERIRMRAFVVTVLALIGGFLGGILLSELGGIIGFVLFDRAVGIRYLPIILGFVCAVAALVWAYRGETKQNHPFSITQEEM
ncbi:MAG: DUF5957 family protein [Ardenticatenaceae bacterium]